MGDKTTVKMMLLFVTLSILFGCQSNINEQNQKENTCLDDYFYWYLHNHGVLNSDEEVLLHLMDDDSLYVKREEVCTLHVIPNWEDKEFPHEVLDFPNLEYLWIAMRDFKELPSKITQLKKLKHLDLQNSNLVKLPDNIGDLTELETLTLLFSDVETLPESICDLANLKKLHLGGTKVKRLPPCLYQLKKLKTFILFYEEKEFSEELNKDIANLKGKMKNCFFHLE